MPLLGRPFSAVVLVGSALVCTLVIVLLLSAEFRDSPRGYSPLLFYLLASIFRLGLSGLYVASVYHSNFTHVLMVGVYDVRDFLMHGWWLLMVGDWCFVIGYLLVDRRSRLSARTRRGHDMVYSSKRIFWFGGAFALLSFILGLTKPFFSFGGLSYLTGYVDQYGTTAGVYIMLHQLHSGNLRSSLARNLTAYGLLFANIMIAAFSYGKSALFVAVIPLILIGLSEAKQRMAHGQMMSLVRPAIGILLVFYAFMFVVSSYSQLRRPDFFFNPYDRLTTDMIADLSVPVARHLGTALLSAVPGTDANETLHHFPATGAWGMVSRMTMPQFAAWSYARVQSSGYKEGGFIKTFLTTVTPRILWPNKPILSPSLEFTTIIGGSRSAARNGQSTGITMQGAYYWWGGMWALLIGCFITGVGFSLTWNLFSRDSSVNPISTLILIVLLYEGFHWFESAFLGSLPFYLYAGVVFLPLQAFLRRWLTPRAPRRPILDRARQTA